MQHTAPAELLEKFSVLVDPDIEDEKIDLVRAALVIARTEYPEPGNRGICRSHRSYGGRVADPLAAEWDGRERSLALNHVLFDASQTARQSRGLLRSAKFVPE